MSVATLVEFDVQAGLQILRAFDERELDIRVAFWGLLEDYSDWRFYVASPLLDSLGIFGGYERLLRIAREVSPALSTFHFDIRKMSEPFIADIRQIVGESDYGARFGGQTFGRSYVEDAFVYRIR